MALIFLLDSAGLDLHIYKFRSNRNQPSRASLADTVLIHE